MKKTYTKKKQGFTLAELLIVVAIIAILVAVSIPIITGKLEAAKKAVCDANKRSALAVYREYVIQNGEFKNADEILSYVNKATDDGIVCPEGDIYFKDNTFRCTYHDDGIDSEDKSNTEIINDILSKLPSGLKTWKDIVGHYVETGKTNFEKVDISELNEMWLKTGGDSKKGLSSSLNLTWKPVATSNGGYVMIASSSEASSKSDDLAFQNYDKKTGNGFDTLTYAIFDGTNYYLHNNGSGRFDSKYVADNGTFDTSSLTSENGWTIVPK